MCFSATASFTAGTALLVIGVVTLRSAQDPKERPFAAIPLLFALQQFCEGIIWLTFQAEGPLADPANVAMTYAYTFFSHVLWPMYVPVAVWLIEPDGKRRRTLAVFAVAGAIVGLFLLGIMFNFPVTSRPTEHHVEYVLPHYFGAATMTLYMMASSVSLILSTHNMVKLFGVLAVLSFIVAYAFYAAWFISVWCFFAGLMSCVVGFYFYPNPRRFQSAINRI